MNARIGIIAALPGEVAPLIRAVGAKRAWRRGRTHVFTSERFVIVYGGMGEERARAACEGAAGFPEVRSLISVGWVGALHDGFRGGDAVWPRSVIDAESGEAYAVSEQGPVLATASRVLDADGKAQLRLRTGADLVDMEAAHVARFARQRQLSFACVRGVSDEYAADLPDMNRFTDSHGQFATVKFVLWLSGHPGSWGTVGRLWRHSSRAAEAIAQELLKV